MSRMENDPRPWGLAFARFSFLPLSQPLSRLFSNDSIRMCFLRPAAVAIASVGGYGAAVAV